MGVKKANPLNLSDRAFATVIYLAGHNLRDLFYPWTVDAMETAVCHEEGTDDHYILIEETVEDFFTPLAIEDIACELAESYFWELRDWSGVSEEETIALVEAVDFESLVSLRKCDFQRALWSLASEYDLTVYKSRRDYEHSRNTKHKH